MILLVTGSRSITSQILVDKACNTFVCEANLRFAESIQIKALKHGDARGVDRLCAEWARNNKIEPIPYPAKWDLITGLPEDKLHISYRNGRPYNVLAGFNRNQEMLDSGFDVLLAIRCLGKSNGTDDQINRVKKLNKPIFLYREDQTFEWIQ